MKNKLPTAVLAFLLLSKSASAANQAPKILIDKGGFIFSASYKLRVPPSRKHTLSELIVKAHVAGSTIATRSPNGPIYPGPFELGVHFRVHNVDAALGTRELRDGRQVLTKETHILPSSDWYYGLFKLLNLFGSRFDPARHTIKQYAIIGAPKAPSRLRIEPLPGCELQATYSLRLAHPTSQSDRRSAVEVNVKEKPVKRHPGKTAVIVTTTLTPTDQNSQASWIQFAKTKAGLYEISRKNIKRASSWYPLLKKIAEKNAVKYLRYRHKHNKLAK